MSNIRNTGKLLNYIKTPLSQNSLSILYSANNIQFERCQLFSDFTESLIITITSTYMGDSFTTPEQRLEHFQWCWNTNINNFSSELIIFYETRELFEYFQWIMIDSFYEIDDKSDMDTIELAFIKMWRYILGYTTNKSRSDVDTFLEIYKIFDKTI